MWSFVNWVNPTAQIHKSNVLPVHKTVKYIQAEVNVVVNNVTSLTPAAPLVFLAHHHFNHYESRRDSSTPAPVLRT